MIQANNIDPTFASGAKIGNFVNFATPTVTQATNRTTGVTVNTLSGQITTNAASLAAETTAVFTVTNSAVEASDVVVVTVQGGTNGGNTIVSVVAVAAGSFNIQVGNNNAAGGAAETGAIVINFLVMKASITS